MRVERSCAEKAPIRLHRTGGAQEVTCARAITQGRKMAEGGGDLFSTSLQKLDNELTCPVCTDHFKDPKVLPCLHYYCKTCIADLIKRAKGRPFNCPECRREAEAEDNDPERYSAWVIYS